MSVPARPLVVIFGRLEEEVPGSFVGSPKATRKLGGGGLASSSLERR